MPTTPQETVPPTSAAPRPSSMADGQPSLSSAVRSTSLMTLGSRFGGLARDVLIGRIFGDTALNSAFQAAFAIPNMFRRLFGEGALSAAFIPQYTQARKQDPAEAGRLASLTLVILAAVTSGLTLVIELGLLAFLLLGNHDHDRRLLVQLVMTMLPFMPMICMVAILAGMLQVHGRFAAAASGPLILNAFIIAIGVISITTRWKAGESIAYLLGAVTVASAATQLWWFTRLLRKEVAWSRDWAPARERARIMFGKFIPVAIGLGTLQLNTFLDTTIATFPIWFETEKKHVSFPLDEASNGILALTSRLYQFPLGVFGIAVASAAFPLLARHAEDPHRFTQTLRRGLRLSLFIGLPATLGLVLVRHDLTAVLFGSGQKAFSDDGLRRSAAALLGFAPGVWAYSLNHVLTRAFYARGDTKTPMKVSIGGMIFNLALNVSLIWLLREAGLAWATSTAAMAQCVVLAFLARKRLCDGPLLDRESVLAMGRIVLASLVMAGAVLLLTRVANLHGDPGWRGRAAALVAATAIGGMSYIAASLVLRVHELRWLISRRAEGGE